MFVIQCLHPILWSSTGSYIQYIPYTPYTLKAKTPNGPYLNPSMVLQPDHVSLPVFQPTMFTRTILSSVYSMLLFTGKHSSG